jgi:hypothetical protein
MARLTARKQPTVAVRRKRTRPILPAAERGYGPEHRAARAAALAAYTPGQPCANPSCKRGGRLFGDPRLFDLGHVPGSGKTAYRGLEHRHCNRSEGAASGNRARGAVSTWRSARSW